MQGMLREMALWVVPASSVASLGIGQMHVQIRGRSVSTVLLSEQDRQVSTHALAGSSRCTPTLGMYPAALVG